MKPGPIIRLAFAAFAVVWALLTISGRAVAKDSELPKELDGIDIEEKPGAILPKDIVLRDQSGKEVRTGDYFDGERPVVLLLAYYDCPMLCSLVLNGLLEQMRALPFTTGKEYRTLVVSFDKRDTVESASAKRTNYLGAYGRPVSDKGWDFLVGDEGMVKKLADSVGFRYRWDEAGQQFAHAAGAFVFTPKGQLSRTLYGIKFPGLKLSLLEASEGKIGGTIDRVLLFCFHYDPSARGYVVATTRLVKAFGILTFLTLCTWLFRLWRAERARARAGQDHETPSQKEGGSLGTPSSAPMRSQTSAGLPVAEQRP